MERKLKIATIGGGSSYTPEIIEGFIKRYEKLPVSELWLVDIEDGREKLEIVGALAQRMVKEAGLEGKMSVHLTLDRREALKDADFVTTQFRVGLLPARIRDEKIPLSFGMIGQETNGVGGFAKAMRTIPVILDICKDMTELCPNAWLVNFTNPSGMVTEAVLKNYPNIKVVGLCNVPIGMKKSVIENLGGVPDNEVEFICGGLNHFVWGRKVLHNGVDKTKEVLEKMVSKEDNLPANLRTRTSWVKEQIQDLGMIPCGYHKYYYLTDEMLGEQLQDLRSGKGIRGEQVKAVEEALFELYKDPNLKVKPKELEKRGGQYYSDAACELITSIYNNSGTEMVVSIRNNGVIDCLPDNVAVELTCKVYADKIVPLPQEPFPKEARGILQLMKSFEEMTVEAAVTGDYNKAIHALTLNPLVTSGHVVKTILNEVIKQNWDYLPQFHHVKVK